MRGDVCYPVLRVEGGGLVERGVHGKSLLSMKIRQKKAERNGKKMEYGGARRSNFYSFPNFLNRTLKESGRNHNGIFLASAVILP